MLATQDLIVQALSLPEPDRIRLMCQLMESLDSKGIENLSHEDWQKEWLAELNSRSAAYQTGESQATDWREALDQMRQSLQRKPRP